MSKVALPDSKQVIKVLNDLPCQWPGGGYRQMEDLFPVKVDVLRRLNPRSVFEIGALYGYFLVAAAWGVPSIEHIGWYDTEDYEEGSNDRCLENLRWLRSTYRDWIGDLKLDLAFGAADPLIHKRHWDVVHVDGDHSYEGCLHDLKLARLMTPRAILVDDTTAETHTEDINRAIFDFQTAYGWLREDVVTANGLAVLRPELQQ